MRMCERWLNLPEPQRDPDVEIYLAGVWMSPGFRKHSSYRIAKIKDELAGGLGLKERDRDDYIRFTGQRVEALHLAKLAKEAWERKQKDLTQSAKKLSNVENT